MSARMVLIATLLLQPLPLLSQIPPVGRLVISSEPPGATITINGKAVSQPTNATLTVSNGRYTISVASADGSLKCPHQAVTVSGGQTVTLVCSSSGWRQP